MILEGNFFRVVESSRDRDLWRVVVELNSEHEIYRGHFPGQPVMPGVCTLGMVKECVEEMIGKKLLLKTIRECKFLASILPQEHRTVEIEFSIEPVPAALWQLKCKAFAGDACVLKLKAELIER